MRYLTLFVFCSLSLAADTAAGKKIYDEHCAGCHGKKGQGAFGSALTGKLKHGEQKAQVMHSISNGIPGTSMPATKLSAANLSALTDYLASLRQPK